MLLEAHRLRCSSRRHQIAPVAIHGQFLILERQPSATWPAGRAGSLERLQESLLLDRIDLASSRHVTVTWSQIEMFEHLVMVRDLARSHAELGRGTLWTCTFDSAREAASSSWRLCRRCSAD